MVLLEFSFQNDGSALSVVEGRKVHFQPKFESARTPAIVVSGKNSLYPKFVIHYESRVMARFQQTSSRRFH